MASGFFKIFKGLFLKPTTGSTVTTQGDVAYNSSTNQLEVFTTAAESLTSASNTQSFTNKTFDVDGTGNSLTNIADANIKTGAAIARAKLASGTANHVVINDSGGAFSSEAQLAVTRGGTGQSSYTDGQLLIGNTSGNTLTKATITAGTGISVTNGNGSITIANTQASPTSQNALTNLGLSVTASSNILTIAVKQADGSTNPASGSGTVSIGFRSSTAANGNYNLRNITAALSQTISQTTRLAFISAQNMYLYLYAIDSDGAGTIKVGAASVQYDETQLQSTVAESFTATISNASPAVVTATGHGLNNNDFIQFTTTGSLPTGLSTNTTYFVVNKATDTFQVSLTPGGTAINTSSAGSGTHTVHIECTRLVSDAVYTNVPIRLIGRAKFNITAGNWATPSEVSIANNQMPQDVISTTRQNSAGTSLTGATDNTLPFATNFNSTHNSFYTDTYVVPLDGFYDVYSATLTTGANWIDGKKQVMSITLNGSKKFIEYTYIYSTTSQPVPCRVSGALKCVQGDLITIIATPTIDSGTAALDNSATENSVIIQRRA